MPARSRLLSWGLPAIGAAMAVAAIAQIATSAPERSLADPPRVPASPEAGAGREVIGATGLVEPSSEQVRVGTPLSGVVAEISVRAGDAVRPGQVVFRLDDRQARAELETRERQWLAAAARLAELEAGIPAARARLEAAVAEAADRREQLRLVLAVGDRRAVSAEDVSRRRFAVDGAEARVREARANLALLDGAGGGATLAAQRAQVEQARAAADEARTQVERHAVRSPLEGTVLQVNVRAGEFAQAGALSTPLVVLGNLTPLHVRVDIDEVDALRFNPGNPATASPRGAGDRRASLSLVRVEPLVVPKTSLTGAATERVDTRVLRVLYALDPRELALFPGQQVDVFVRVAPPSAGGGR